MSINGAYDITPSAELGPVTVAEQRPKVRRLQVMTSRITGKDGRPVITLVASPGFAICKVVISDVDPASQRCKVGVITERRRGRPAKIQRLSQEPQA